MAKNKNEGFRSGAGLIRYFDDEEQSGLKIPPWFVVAACIATSAIVVAASMLYPM